MAKATIELFDTPDGGFAIKARFAVASGEPYDPEDPPRSRRVACAILEALKTEASAQGGHVSVISIND